MILFKNGNKKIGNDTLIFNITSATECPSRKRGLCQLDNPNKCYALKAERMYPNVKPARDKQREYWDITTWDKIVEDILNKIFTVKLYGKRKIKYFRFNESGDFRDQYDVDKAFWIAKRIPNVTFYCYTARSDLTFTYRPKNFIVNGSGFMVDNCFTVRDIPKGYKHSKCKNDCRECKLCKVAKGRYIKQEIH